MEEDSLLSPFRHLDASQAQMGFILKGHFCRLLAKDSSISLALAATRTLAPSQAKEMAQSDAKAMQKRPEALCYLILPLYLPEL